MILLDSNLLGRMPDKADAHHGTAHQSVRKLRRQKEQLVIVPQNLFEFWAVATRDKAHNGLSMSTDRATLWVGYFRRLFTFLPDRPELTATWLDLVKIYGVKGFKAHDARLVAAMQTYGIRRILTFNAADFRKFPISIVDPQLV
jgi:predicted nucleic acid-binding protein